jgi:hypothetical protein
MLNTFAPAASSQPARRDKPEDAAGNVRDDWRLPLMTLSVYVAGAYRSCDQPDEKASCSF